MFRVRVNHAYRAGLTGGCVAALMALALTGVPASAASASGTDSPDLGHSAATAQKSKSSGDQDYIVKLEAGSSVGDLVTNSDLTRKDVSENLKGPALTGAVVTVDGAEARSLQDTPGVDAVELDQPVSALEVQNTAGEVPWGLDRSDQSLGLNGSYQPPADGAGTHVYVVDTGIDLDHPELKNRIGSGIDLIDVNGTADDCNGHGTHVAGTIASGPYGMAPNATVHPVRVLDCRGSGTTSAVIAGLNWIKKTAPARSVVNLSLGGGRSPLLDSTVTDLVNSNITVVAAAGNERSDACNVSPAAAAAALTVGATTNNDQQSGFSNFGSCLDLYAPGSAITSTVLGGGTASYSGTSMAAPHVAGAAAVYWSFRPAASAGEVIAAVVNQSTPNVLALPSTASQSPNRLLNVNFAGVPAPPQPQNPPAAPAPPPATTSTAPEPVVPPQLRNQSPAKIKIGKLTRKKAKIRWATLGSADKYLVKIKQLTRGKAKTKFQARSSKAKISGLTSGAKYRITVVGVSGSERSQKATKKFRTKR